MPLIKSSSKEARQKNIKTELEHGKPIDVATAIAYSIQREAAGKERHDGESKDKKKERK